MLSADYDDNGAYWRSWYETPDFDEYVADLWEQVLPLYEQLHAYVNRKLREVYVNGTFFESGFLSDPLLTFLPQEKVTRFKLKRLFALRRHQLTVNVTLFQRKLFKQNTHQIANGRTFSPV